GWTDVERLTRENVQRGTAVVAQVAHLPSQPHAGHDPRRKSGPCAREGFVLDAVGWKQACPIVCKLEVDRADQVVTFELAVGEYLDFGTVVAGSHAARFVHEAPMRRHAQGQAEWGVCAIQDPEPPVEGYRLNNGAPGILYARNAGDVVV